jgi:hypothetical protein
MAGESRLVGALRRAFNMMVDDAEATASVVSSVFRGEEEVNDEDLDKEIRALFYTLEKEELLGIRRTEYKFEGQVRRAYFWRLKKLPLDDENGGLNGMTREDMEAMKVYRALPQEMWTRGKN